MNLKYGKEVPFKLKSLFYYLYKKKFKLFLMPQQFDEVSRHVESCLITTDIAINSLSFV